MVDEPSAPGAVTDAEPEWFAPHAARLRRIDENTVTIRAWVVFFGRLLIVVAVALLIDYLGWIDVPWIEYS